MDVAVATAQQMPTIAGTQYTIAGTAAIAGTVVSAAKAGYESKKRKKIREHFKKAGDQVVSCPATRP